MNAYTPKTSDEKVATVTGKTWHVWFALLDKAGAKKLPHDQIVRIIYPKYLKRGWWAQMVTVEYERSRGLRGVNERREGTFEVSVHKTYGAPVAKIFAAWQKEAKKLKLKESTVHKNKTIRYKAEKGKPLIIVAFASQGPAKSRLGMSVERLSKREDVEKQRAYWRRKLENLI